MTRTTTAQRAETARYEWLEQRADAEEHRCPTCLAAPAVTCRNVHTGRPLQHQPAHLARMALGAGSPTIPAPGPSGAAGLHRTRCSLRR